MAFVFTRRLAVPFWTMALGLAALIAPPAATLSLMPTTIPLVMAIGGMAALVSAVTAMPQAHGSVPSSRR